MKLRENFTDNMKLIFERSSYSLAEFADELSISRSALQDILKGSSNPTLSTVDLIAEKLDIDPISLLSVSETQMPAADSLTQLLDWILDLPGEERPLAAKAIETFLLTAIDDK